MVEKFTKPDEQLQYSQALDLIFAPMGAATDGSFLTGQGKDSLSYKIDSFMKNLRKILPNETPASIAEALIKFYKNITTISRAFNSNDRMTLVVPDAPGNDIARQDWLKDPAVTKALEIARTLGLKVE